MRRRTSRTKIAAFLFTTAGACLLPAQTWAQFDQYTAPAGPAERPRDRREQLKGYVEEARHHLGPVRLDPWVSLHDVEYLRNAFGGTDTQDPVSDVTATVGAGLRAYLPLGSDVTVAAHLLPEYVWWKDLAGRRRLNGRYGLGVFGFFNRLAVEATAQRDQQRGYATPEFPQPVNVRSDRASLSAQVALGGSLSLFGSVEDVALRTLVDDPDDPRTVPLDRLDRDDTILRTGLRYKLPHHWSVATGVEISRVDFVSALPEDDRSNSGTSPLLQVQRDGENVYLALEVARRTLDPDRGSTFVPYRETTANLQAGFNTNGRISFTLYGGRGIVYALTEGYSYIQDDHLGGAVQVSLGWRTRLQVYVEGGHQDYVAESPLAPSRDSDVQALGGVLSFAARGRTSIVLRGNHTLYDSNLPGLDRTITSFGVGLTLSGNRASW